MGTFFGKIRAPIRGAPIVKTAMSFFLLLKLTIQHALVLLFLLDRTSQGGHHVQPHHVFFDPLLSVETEGPRIKGVVPFFQGDIYPIFRL